VVSGEPLPASLRDPGWVARADCQGGPPSPALCRRCPVAEQCLAFALVTDDRAPLRAGLSREERLHTLARLEGLADALDPWIFAEAQARR